VTLEYAAAFSLLGFIPAELEQTYVIPILHGTWSNAKCFAKATRRELDTPVYLQHCEAVYNLVESGKVYAADIETIRRAKKAALRDLIRQSRRSLDKNAGPPQGTGVPA
jgi:hypothetical protein